MTIQFRAKRKSGTKYYFDYNLLAVVIILICFGLVMLYSASSYEGVIKWGNDMYYLIKQGGISVGAVIVAVVISKIDYHFWCKGRVAFFIYVLSIALMCAVKWSPLAITAGGSTRWLGIGPISFQPSEIAKIAVILITTSVIIRGGREFYKPLGTFMVFALGLFAATCAFWLTDNLSTAIIILAISVFMIFIAHPRTKGFVITWLLCVVAVAIIVLYLQNNMDTSENFRLRRILAWLDPEKYSDIGGYQVLQGLYAIGSGGFFGKGLGNSTQKLSTIPEAQNDMIFSIVCEELGLFGAILLLLLFGYLLYRLFVIAQNAADLKGTLIASGIFIHIALQVILNICVVLNLIPTTGVTLPFVSYGGTSVLFLMVEIGVALNISSQIEIKKTVRARRRIKNNISTN